MHSGNIERACLLVANIIVTGIQPTAVISYSTIIDGFVNTGNLDPASQGQTLDYFTVFDY